MKHLASCWAGLLLCAAAPFALAANTWTVTSTGSGGACTAGSTTDANCTLDVAISDAADGDAILFAASVQGQVISGNFLFAKGLTIDGGARGVILDGGGAGSVVDIEGGAVVLKNLTVQNGMGNNSGGGILGRGTSLTIDSCTVAHNTASGFGAGIDTGSGTTTTIINSTIADNTVTNLAAGGGIYGLGDLVIANSTITGNAASGVSPYGYGGGILATGGLTLLSSIVAGNSATAGAPDINNNGSTSTLGYNIVGNLGAYSGLGAPATGDQFNVDPMFVSTGLADNGGATQTVALQSLSPARAGGNCAGNAGSPTLPAITLDQRGYTRTSSGAIGCTVGAFDMTSIFYNGFE